MIIIIICQVEFCYNYIMVVLLFTLHADSIIQGLKSRLGAAKKLDFML